MIALINDSLRYFIGIGCRCLGALLSLVQSMRIAFFLRNQTRLTRKYGLTAETPILSFGEELELLIDAAAAKRNVPARFPVTSGSTGTPKRILFTAVRLRALKLLFTDFFVRCCWSFSISRTSLYVFSSFDEDDSLTSMLLEEKRLPSYLSTLQAPYRVQSDQSLRSLASRYGTAAVRLWILTLSNPGVLYSTNPSTLSTFFDELEDKWTASSELVRDWHHRPEIFEVKVHRIARRLRSAGYKERLARLAASTTAMSIEIYAPAVTSYICWTGGYVKPFLERLQKYLPVDRYRLIPMYSMSTETVETIAYVTRRCQHFLPMAPGVLYEFVEEESGVRETKLLKPHELRPGKSYVMLVSDAYGLRRYDTQDVFLCRTKIHGGIHGLPNLVFMRRRDLQYSFTGEKLTAAQIVIAFEQLRSSSGLRQDQFLACIPSHPTTDAIPHYKLVMVSNKTNPVELRSDAIATMCDRLFSELNCEYKSKRETRRLGPVRFVRMDQTDFVNLLSNSGQANSWETQFKFLPLYLQTWESLNKQSGAMVDIPAALLPHV